MVALKLWLRTPSLLLWLRRRWQKPWNWAWTTWREPLRAFWMKRVVKWWDVKNVPFQFHPVPNLPNQSRPPLQCRPLWSVYVFCNCPDEDTLALHKSYSEISNPLVSQPHVLFHNKNNEISLTGKANNCVSIVLPKVRCVHLLLEKKRKRVDSFSTGHRKAWVAPKTGKLLLIYFLNGRKTCSLLFTPVSKLNS